MEITLKGNYETRQVWLNGKELSPVQSQKIRNHSPDGFSWGYSGSGCSQFALAILMKFYVSNFALEHYQYFKSKVISALPQSDFEARISIDIPKDNSPMKCEIVSVDQNCISCGGKVKVSFGGDGTNFYIPAETGSEGNRCDTCGGVNGVNGS